MNANEYQRLAMSTATGNRSEPILDKLINGILGLVGESGEVADHVKKHVFQYQELSYGHLAEELGDVCWYIALLADAIGYSFDDILRINLEKSKKRYPNGFDSERSRNRSMEDTK